jgi:uncharacterized protein (DUF1697 family)
MAWAVFLRGVNVGAARRVSTADVARKLGATNLGAAGTFVVDGASAAKVKAAVAKALPFETQIAVRPGREVTALVERDPFADAPRGARGFVSVLTARPKSRPRLPVERPEGDGWIVRVLEAEGAFALSVRKPGGARYYPNEVVEKLLGAPATTRDWSTMTKLAKLLGD